MKNADGNDPSTTPSAADILLAGLIPDYPQPLQQGDAPDALQDDLEDDWSAAINARYGSAQDVPEGANASKGRKRKKPSNSQGEGVIDDGLSSMAELPFLQHLSDSADIHRSVVPDPEAPIRTWIDTANKRAIAEFSDGRKIAMGYLM